MDMDRKRPPKDCKDLEYWLSRTVHDAIRDCIEAGMPRKHAAMLMAEVTKSCVRGLCLPKKEIERMLGIESEHRTGGDDGQ